MSDQVRDRHFRTAHRRLTFHREKKWRAEARASERIRILEKWADYGISAVKYNRDHTAIVEVKARADNGDGFGGEEKFSRSKVIERIESGWSFVTIVKDGKVEEGRRRWHRASRRRKVHSHRPQLD